MSDVAIRVEGLSKKYVIGHNNSAQSQNGSFRELLSQRVKNFGRKAGDIWAGNQIIQGDEIEEFWALKDINFTLKKGERLGVVGRNGAGKSTLLKVLSRIIDPTEGVIEIDGRVSSLLEVGTGFHPELSGRENVYLNGAILGMTKREIDSKFKEIVAFAEIEKFIDTPVKRYSSGMYVRLAFAVAAHLEPEILIVDEVLAVGDAQFQKKCISKINDIGGRGTTVLFVSHNMSSMRSLCSQGILLKNGQIKNAGSMNAIALAYINEGIGDGFDWDGSRSFMDILSKEFQVQCISLKNDANVTTSKFHCDENINIEIECISRRPVPGLYGYIGILTREGQVVWVSDSFDSPPNCLDALTEGSYVLNIPIPKRTLGHGDYVLLLSFTSSQANSGFIVDRPGEVLDFSVTDMGSMRGDERDGFFSTLLNWNIAKT